MSLNEIVSPEYKPWLNVRANNLVIDNNLTARGGQENFILGYDGDGHATFSPQRNIINLSIDAFSVIPINSVGAGLLNFQNGPIPENHFTVNANNDIVCDTAGVYLFILKFLEGQTQPPITVRPNPYIKINNGQTGLVNLRIPLCTTTIPNHAGCQMTSIVTLSVNDLIQLQLGIQPTSGTINMMNEYFASNVKIIKIG